MAERMRKCFTKAEVEKLLAAVPDGVARVLVLVMLETGLRVGELRALRWSDVDLENRYAHVGAIVRGEGSVIPSIVLRRIELRAGAVEALRSWRDETGGRRDDFVLSAGSSERPAGLPALRRALHQAALAAGIELDGRGFIALRNTFTMAALERGESLTWIANQLGSRIFQSADSLRFVRVDPHVGRTDDAEA